MLLLESCGQKAMSPQTNAAAKRVFTKIGIYLHSVRDAGCCGAVDYHLGAHRKGLLRARANIDAWWPTITSGCEAIIVTASGCGPMIKDYGNLLQDDPFYAEKAAKVSSLAKDISEILAGEDLASLKPTTDSTKRALHIPCSLQHGLKASRLLENIFETLGFNMVKTSESHLCCGSAGAYSLLQPELSERLLDRKIKALSGDTPDEILTANIGCQLHLQSKSPVPVKHWIEVIDSALSYNVIYPVINGISRCLL